MHDGYATISQLSLSVFFCVCLALVNRVWFNSFACNSSCFSQMNSQACSRITFSLCLNNSLWCLYLLRYFVWDINILLMVEGPRCAFNDGKGWWQQREVAATAAAELDCDRSSRGVDGGSSSRESGWQLQQTCKLVKRWKAWVHFHLHKVTNSFYVNHCLPCPDC